MFEEELRFLPAISCLKVLQQEDKLVGEQQPLWISTFRGGGPEWLSNLMQSYDSYCWLFQLQKICSDSLSLDPKIFLLII
ncbi:hypothetical protein Syun_014309 [Stephania yunnanensis]|uniref:Uncharacterized protein n=1 Tax=Stephania yunnanensis TaxID=152371 RepID=A0AAP0P9F1_9MAGN